MRPCSIFPIRGSVPDSPRIQGSLSISVVPFPRGKAAGRFSSMRRSPFRRTSMPSKTHLEEEVRRETLVKDLGHFLRFLKFAAGDSGGIVNLAAISRETGVAAQTIKAYYQALYLGVNDRGSASARHPGFQEGLCAV